jgi:hypothetical protein
MSQMQIGCAKQCRGNHLVRNAENSKSATMTTTSPDADEDRRPQEETEDGEVDVHDGEMRCVDRAKEQVEQEGDKKRKSKDGRGAPSRPTKSPKSKSLEHSSSTRTNKVARVTNAMMSQSPPPSNRQPEEGSDECWNQQRVKLGPKPLKK